MTSDQMRQLFELSNQIAQSAVLTQQLINEIEGRSDSSLLAALRNCLGELQLKDIGVTDDTFANYFVPSYITYTSIYESRELSICFFALSKGTGLPLHDHPQMAVITQVLTGRLKFKLADLIKCERDNIFSYREVSLGELSAPGELTLTPASCNLHQFVAMENTVMLDIFIPSYSQVRDVTYFLEISESLLCGLKTAFINFREMPYRGARISDSQEA